jgi:hypothetical protein
MDVNERNLCGRLARQLDLEMKHPSWTGYYVDLEYNRKQDARVKTIFDHRLRSINITPDIILHSRGESAHPADDNLIAIEMKKASRPIEAVAEDRLRLMAMTKDSWGEDVYPLDGYHPEHVCGYRVGVLLVVDPASVIVQVEQYRGGQLYRKHTFAIPTTRVA